MPDPRLVSRAQRAATMLERAWERWRATQGLEAEPMPPVSSYVGYSIEEPWGRPRVVFGVNAEDAERLAALLQESVGYGPDGLPRPADPGYRPPARSGFAADRPAVPDRGYPDNGHPDRGYDQSLLDDVRGRIPVQGWPPEFSESREQLNGAGPSQLDEPELPLDLGPLQADVASGDPLGWTGELGRPHDLKLPGELGLSDEFRGPDDFLDADEVPLADGVPGADERVRDDEREPFGVHAPYGVPYAGGAPYAVPYTGEPYDPDGPYGQSGGHGEAGPYRAEEESADISSDAPQGPPRIGEPGRGGAAASPEVLAGAAREEDAQRDLSGPDESGRDEVVWDESGPEESGRDEDLRDESGRDEDLRDESGRDESGQDESGRDEDLRDESGRDEDLRDGDARPSGGTPDRIGGAGKHMLAGEASPRMDAHGEDALDRDAQPGETPRAGDGPPGPRHGSTAEGPAWPPSASAGLAAADSRQEPQADAEPDEAPGARAEAADRPADPASRGSITDTMAAELAGWAAGELPGQAAARLASWASAGGAVARGRQQARLGGGGTAAERVS